MTDFTDIAERFGTPAYVYDLDRVRSARADLMGALPKQFEVFYALKANPHPEVVRALRSGRQRPCRAEISSTGELDVALEAGFAGSEILYTGPGKTDGELTYAIANGVRLFSTESIGDLRRVGQVAVAAGVVANCLLRINSATSNSTTSIRMTGTPSQFGFDSEVLPSQRDDVLGVPGTSIAGAHFYPLSNAADEDSLIGEFLHTIALAATLQNQLGVQFRFVDIGGGFAAPYAKAGERPVYSRLATALGNALDESFPGWRLGEPQIACESGRYLVGDSGDLIAGVVNQKESRGRRFVVVDAGINTFGGMSGLGRLLPVSVRPRADGRPSDQKASLVGPLCTPGDLLGRDIELPALESGDIVVIPNAGAYGVTASLLMFLGRPAPVEVLVSGGEVVSASRLRHVRDIEVGIGSVSSEVGVHA